MFWRFRRATLLVILFMYFYLAIPENAYAYLDPGTGSYLLQLIIAAILGSLVFLKSFWRSVRLSVTNLISKSGSDSKETVKK